MHLLSRLIGRPDHAGEDWIEPQALAAQLAGSEAPLMLDVRGADEFDGPLGHIAGAVNLPLGELAPRLAELAGASRPLVTVCLTDRRSAAAAAQLRAAGAGRVAVLRGGMQRWRELGLG